MEIKFKTEFHKVILLFLLLLDVFIIIFTAYMAYKICSPELCICLAGAATAQIGSAIVMYQWKTKSNNNFKYAEQFIFDMADKYGIEDVKEIAVSFLGNMNLNNGG